MQRLKNGFRISVSCGPACLLRIKTGSWPFNFWKPRFLLVKSRIKAVINNDARISGFMRFIGSSIYG
jgi:hypothetical protein